MLNDELNTPLEVDTGPQHPSGWRRPLVAPTLISFAAILALTAALWVAVVDDPDGGRPVAVAEIEDAVPPMTGSVAPDKPQVAATAPAATTVAPAITSYAPLGGDNGTSSQGQLPADTMQLAALPQLPPAVGGDPSLLEFSNFGSLPRVSPDGRRPRDAYARRSSPVPEGTPRIVIVIGGLGLSQTGTQNAIEQLPDEVTLAFAPYGSSLERWVGKARQGGHEVLLQIPLEPLNYPQENPGEHTLLVSGGNNRDDLYWALGRMTAYAGVMNHMGSRFTQDERALVPFLGEIGQRGLFYLDDGSSPQSLAPQLGKALDVPVLTADRTLDRARDPRAIESELAALEATARAKGLAIGVASAFPSTVETIARWARDAEARGIIIIPASAAIAS